MSALSKGLQNTQKLPWEREEELEVSLEQLGRMQQSLPKSAAPASQRLRGPADIQRALEETTPEEFADAWPNLHEVIGSRGGVQEQVTIFKTSSLSSSLDRTPRNIYLHAMECGFSCRANVLWCTTKDMT